MSVSLRNICQECVDKREEDFLRVREYIKDNPRVSIEVVAEATDVQEQTVRAFLREGKIQSAGFGEDLFECRKCGKSISSGIYCPICQKDLRNGLASSADEKSARSGRRKKTTSLTLRYRRRG